MSARTMCADGARPSKAGAVALMFFLLIPFFRPSIVNDWSAFSTVKVIFAMWLLASCVLIAVRFVRRNGTIDMFVSGLFLALAIMVMSTRLQGGSLYDALLDSTMIFCAALLVVTLDGSEVEAFLLALVGTVLTLVLSELVLRALLPFGIYFSDGSARWLLEDGSLQSRWCYVLVFAAGVLDYLKKERMGSVFLISSLASLLLVFQLSSATSTVALVVEIVAVYLSGISPVQRVLKCRNVNFFVFAMVVLVVFVRIGDYLPYDSIATLLGKDLTYSSGATFTGRTYIWDSVIESISQRPMFGYGFQQYVATDIYQIYSQQDFGSAHNLWLQVAYQGGLVGLFAFMLSYFSLCRKADAVGDVRFTTLYASMVAAFMITSVFENTLNSVLVISLAIADSPGLIHMLRARAAFARGGSDG